MEVNKLVELLRKVKIETGSMACLGCGYEHNCSLHGCAILRETADQLERLNNFSESQCAKLLAEKGQLRQEAAYIPVWVSVKDGMPKTGGQVLVIASGKPMSNLTLYDAYELAEYTPEGWVFETWPEWEDANVTHWMPLPAAPEERTVEK